jgi:prephenate dehydratase
MSLSAIDSPLEPAPDVRSIIHAVESGAVRLGLVPIENSVEGEVTAHVDELLFKTASSYVVAEVVVPVAFFAYSLGSDTVPAVAISHPPRTGDRDCRLH